jgi:Na+:H+ antiporter, NhaA family
MIPTRERMKLTDTFVRFARSEQFGGVLLIGCTALSLVLANSPAGPAWLALWHVQLGPLSAEHWINDALMAVFFLLIGLELERELYVGELSNPRQALLPAIAALGGMAVPALIHVALNVGTPTAAGFGIPMATDIAFALGILALLGTRVPPALKVFVVAFAVIDDLGAIIVIAVAYSGDLAWEWMGAALACFAGLLLLNRPLRVMALTPFLVGGALLWLCLLKAGVHASIAGVLLAFAIPFTARRGAAASPSQRLEHALHAPVAYGVLPLFALANTGIVIDVGAVASLAGVNGLGILLGLAVGKPLGVTLACVAAVRSRMCALPEGAAWRHVVGAGMLGGIGFTMSIFITNLAFAGDAKVINGSKLAILVASAGAGIVGSLWLRRGAAVANGDSPRGISG